MATVEYAYYHENFGTGIEHANNIDDIAETTFASEYEDTLHYGKIFCPRCKVALKRTPRDKEKTSNGKDAFFCHYKSEIKCAWHTQTSKGKKYLNEEDTWKVIANEMLTVVPQWSTVPDEEQRQNGIPIYTGVNEDPCSDEVTEQALGRYREGEIPLPNRITSVRTIARHINAYKHKAIIMPGSDRAIEVQSMLRALDTKTFQVDGNEYLFFGRVHQYNSGNKDGPYDFLNIQNETQTTSIWVPKAISKNRKFTQKTEGRVVLVYGELIHKSQVYAVKVSALGQIALVPEDKERFFWYSK